MLRQIFRNRGAYNFVNVPVVASQDDPYGNRDWNGNWTVDWRRNYVQPMQQEFREDVGCEQALFYPSNFPTAYFTTDTRYNGFDTGFADFRPVEAWDRPNWWTDKQLSSTAAAKILRKRLEVYGPQREKSLQEVISRIRNEKDAQNALKTAELFRRYRSSREQHTPFKNATSRMIIQRALEVDARDVVVKALERKDELGFAFMSLKAYRLAITHFSTKGDLENVFKVFALARKQGMKPNRDIAFCILRACLDCNRADLAHAYAIEFQENGLRVSPAQKIVIEQGSGHKIPAFRGPESEHAYEPIQFQVASEIDDDSEDEILEEADRIIAAAESSDIEPDSPRSPKRANEIEAADLHENDKKTLEEDASPAPENKVAEEAAEATSGSKKVVAALSVEKDTDNTDSPSIAAHYDSAEEGPLLVPGMDEAINDHMRKWFIPKPRTELSKFRRVNSM